MNETIQRNTFVGAGFVALDVVHAEDEACIGRFAGGSCGNVGTILSYLGWSTSLLARIGDDAAGDILLNDLDDFGVNLSGVIRERSKRTPVIFERVRVDASEGPRHSFTRKCPSCGSWAASYRPVLKRTVAELYASVPRPTVYYFDRVAPANIELARLAHEDGALVVFEPSSIKDERLFREGLKLCHVFKYSEGRFDDVHDLELFTRVPAVVSTRGDQGLEVSFRRLGAQSHTIEMAAIPTSGVRDEAGSGDWCTAGLVMGLANKEAFPEEILAEREHLLSALRLGQAMAALNCKYIGARGAMYHFSPGEILGIASEATTGSSGLTRRTCAEALTRKPQRRTAGCIQCES